VLFSRAAVFWAPLDNNIITSWDLLFARLARPPKRDRLYEPVAVPDPAPRDAKDVGTTLMDGPQMETDYIIVGAGSAGCLLANRLSADADAKVILLEAGGSDWSPLIRVPLMAGALYTKKSINWGFETTEQSVLDNRRLEWPRGKVLGGSSSINGMVYMRGHRADFDNWAEHGLPGWAYEDVLPIFRRSEGHQDRRDDYHGTKGELSVSRSRTGNPLEEAFLEACDQNGYAATDDFNGATQSGFGLHDLTISRGRRVSSAGAFLHKYAARPNLKIFVRAHCRRLLVERSRVTGVEASIRGSRETIRARREVILCAGAVNSPALLELSGIGDAERLRSVGIKTVHNLPGVGENLQDHLGAYVQHQCLEPVTLNPLFGSVRGLAVVGQAMVAGSGVASSVPLRAAAFIGEDKGHGGAADIKCTFIPALSLDILQTGDFDHGFQIALHQLRPASRGSVHVVSSDPKERPAIDPNYFAEEQDRDTLSGGVLAIRELLSQRAFDKFRGAEIAPGSAAQSRPQVLSWICQNSKTVFHPVGTCRMGTDASAVVNERLEVQGLQGLRVADASVMPNITSGNTNAPTLMIAEKAAEMIGRS